MQPNVSSMKGMCPLASDCKSPCTTPGTCLGKMGHHDRVDDVHSKYLYHAEGSCLVARVAYIVYANLI